MKKIRLTESGLKGFVRAIVEQVDDEYYHMDPSDFMTMIDAGVNRLEIVTKLKRFKGKPLWIDGNLDLSGRPITTLGNIAGVSGDLKLSNNNKLKDLGNLKYVQGQLDISYSSVSSVDGVEYGNLRAYDSELENKVARAEYNKKFASVESDRAEGIYDKINGDEDIAKRWALLQYLGDNEGSVMIMTDEVKEEYSQLKTELASLEERYDAAEDEDTIDELTEEIDLAQNRIEEIENEYIDVYDIVEAEYSNYGMTSYLVKGLGNYRNPNEYSVGTEDEADRGLESYWENYVDDVGLDGFNEYTIEGHIDGDDVANDARDYIEDDIRENLEGYFNLDNLDLTDDQEREIAVLQQYIEELETYISDLEEEQTSMDFDTDNEDEYERQQQELQVKIDEAEQKKDETQDKIDGIEPEVTEDMIESEVDDRVSEIRRDPLQYLKDHGYDKDTIMNYVDLKSLTQELIQNGDYGDMNSNSGDYDSVRIDGTYYIVMKTN